MNLKKISKLFLTLLVIISAFFTTNINVSANEVNEKESLQNPALLTEFTEATEDGVSRRKEETTTDEITNAADQQDVDSTSGNDDVDVDLPSEPVQEDIVLDQDTDVQVNEQEIIHATNQLYDTIQPRAGPNIPVNDHDIPGTSAIVTDGTYTVWYDAMGWITVNGVTNMCVEGLQLGLNGQYTEADFPAALRNDLAIIKYNAFDLTSKSGYDYATAQVMIWERMGLTVTLTGDFANYYPSMKAAAQAKINNHKKLPSFDGTTQTVQLGSSITLTDTNNVLGDFTIKSVTGLNISKSGNTLTLTPTGTIADTVLIRYQKAPDSAVGSGIYYHSPDGQDCSPLYLSDPVLGGVTLNTEKYGTLEIAKMDNKGNYISGGEFKVYDSEAKTNTVGTYTTGSNGKVEVTNTLLPGDYWVGETKVPDNLVLDTTLHKITIEANKTTTYTQTNKWKQGYAELSKQDDYGNLIKKSAEFDVYNPSGVKIGSITMVNGVAKTGLLDYGKGYYFLETKAPDGYLISSDKIYFDITEDGATVKVTAKNKHVTGSITLTKQDSETGNTAQGDASLVNAIYPLIAEEDIPAPWDDSVTIYKKGELISKKTVGGYTWGDVGTKSTDSTYKINWTNLPLGKYSTTEKTPSEGYNLDPTKHVFNLTYKNQTTSVVTASTTSNEDVIKGNFFLHKFVNTGSTGLQMNEPGAVFEARLKSEVKLVGRDNAKVYTATTGLDGIAEFNGAPYGTYIFTQIKAGNENWDMAPEFEGTITYHGQVITYAIGNNLHTSYVQLLKYDADLGEYITFPATFQIWDVDNNEWYTEIIGNKVIDEWTTDETGMLITNKVLPAGNYEFVETGTPSGYLDAEERIPFTITSSNVHETNIDGKPILVVRVSNQAPKGSMKLNKLFERIEGLHDEEALVSGWKVTYEKDVIANYDGETVIHQKGEQLVNTESDDGLFYATEDTILEMNDIYVGYGEGTTLRVDEVVYPQGYVQAESFTETWKKGEDDNTTKVIEIDREVENKIIRTDLEIVKKDQYTDEIAKGEVFGWTMYADADLTQEILKLSTDPQTGKATLKNLPYGFEGYLVETSAPEGWYLSDEVVHVLLDESTEGLGSTYSIDFYNKPKPIIGTTATGINGEKTLDPTVDNETIDVIAHENIDIDLTYVVETVAISDKVIALIEEATGKEYSSLSEAEKKEALKVAIKENPELIKARETEKDVRFETKDGEHEVKITIPANSFEDGEGLVYLEYLFNQETYNPEPTEEEPNIPVVEHEDPTDPGQTSAKRS